MAKVTTTIGAQKLRAISVFDRLHKAYASAHCSLDFRSPLELLVSTILAAQCTDERVNVVTKSLFKKYRRPEDYLAVEQEELEKDIQSCGFYRNKAKNIRAACEKILTVFGGKVPGTMDELLQLDGVGRKTANVLLGECFGVQGIIVDTHCGRLARRLGFTKNDDPGKVEHDLMRIVPKENWTMFSHCMVFHGRAICAARSPKCSECPVAELCPFPDTKEGKAIAK